MSERSSDIAHVEVGSDGADAKSQSSPTLYWPKSGDWQSRGSGGFIEKAKHSSPAKPKTKALLVPAAFASKLGAKFKIAALARGVMALCFSESERR